MRFLFDNAALKLLSLGLAVALWYVIAGEQTSEMGLSVPVELQNFPPDLELTGDAVDSVEVRLRASPGIIQRLTPGDVSARIDLAGAQEGERILHLTADSIRVPFGVKVVKITPAILTLNFERTLAKSVPIRPRLTGQPGAGYEVAEVTAEPAEVRMSGPKSRVQEIESAFTEPVSVDGAQTTVVEQVNIGVEDPLLRIQGNPRVRVTARVREVEETRELGDLEILVRGGRAGLRPGRARVTLRGPATTLARIRPADVRPWIDAAGAQVGQSLPVAVELAPGFAGVVVKATDPEQVVLRPARGKGNRG